MAQAATTQTAREASLARRRALTSKGKSALAGAATINTGQTKPASNQEANGTVMSGMPARKASLARREAMSTSGKAGITSNDRTRVAPAQETSVSSPIATQKDTKANGCGCGCNGTKATCNTQTNDESSSPAMKMPVRNMMNKNIARNTSRAASLARREAMSSRGKAGINAGSSAAQTARAGNPHLSSRELAKTLREQRSRQGKSGEKKSQPAGRMRPNANNAPGAAEDASWKVGASETAEGQTLTGTMVGRSQKVTGDEPSTCRDVTGTDYMGADIFRDFCQGEPGKMPRKVEVTSTSHGNQVSGNKMGRGSNVTGDEPGTCKRVTGNEYVGSSQEETFCGSKPEAGPGKITSSDTRKGKTLTGNNVGRSEKVTGDETGANRDLTGSQYMQPGEGKAPGKVGSSTTLRGGSISGTLVGRSQKVTGDEPGSCRNVTGDDYIGQEQYSGFCNKTPQPKDQKVGVSSTLTGKDVTGTLTERSGKVTGDEPGTCKAVTGTPYASADQYTKYCKPEEASLASSRARQNRGTPGQPMTGQQPGIGGKMTGANKGACENVSGTPYVGADQFSDTCPATAADTSSPDFPQTMANTPWGQFSVEQPSGGAQQGDNLSAVTGSQYEQGHITGPFGMATGKVTGTEEARFENKQQGHSKPAMPATAEMVEGRVKSRISGEGMDAGAKITGDDWDRGDHVTGTEGLSATRRNPTIHSNVSAGSIMQALPKRNEEMQNQVSKVTGGSGNTEKGSLITYSGGARG